MFSIEQAKEMHQLWFDAYKDASSGKAYTIEGRSLTRQDLPQIKKELQYWSDIIADLTGQRAKSRVGRIVLVDL